MFKPRLFIIMTRLLYSLFAINCVCVSCSKSTNRRTNRSYEFSPAVLQSQIFDMHAHGSMLGLWFTMAAMRAMQPSRRFKPVRIRRISSSSNYQLANKLKPIFLFISLSFSQSPVSFSPPIFSFRPDECLIGVQKYAYSICL